MAFNISRYLRFCHIAFNNISRNLSLRKKHMNYVDAAVIVIEVF